MTRILFEDAAIVAAMVLSLASCGVDSSGAGGLAGGAETLLTANPILFVTQVPVPNDFTTIGSTFGNHRSTPQSCPRGGDLWIRYANGVLRNLTQAAGYGNAGAQGASSVAVREPCVHWNGQKAVFSMLLGSPGQFQPTPAPWQLYEVTGWWPTDTVVITTVANQPTGYNNTSPCYTSDGRILFTSDRPRGGHAQSNLHPQRDEYEQQPTNTGIWSLDPPTGTLFLMQHSPSGSFSPSVDSSGRVVFTRWDHLERDQEADDDRIHVHQYGTSIFNTFNWSDESAGSVPTASNAEVFPDPRVQWIDFVNGTPGYTGNLAGWASNLVGNTFNHFLPWQVRQDGREEETLGHVGRHEIFNYFNAVRDDDPNVISFLGPTTYTANPRPLNNLFQLREDPLDPGTYFGVDAPEFFTHASGQIVRLRAPAGMSPDAMVVDYITHRDTAFSDPTPSVNHSGHYRNPLPLSDGQWIASHTAQTDVDQDIGTPSAPKSKYDFRLKKLVFVANRWKAGRPLTRGIKKVVQWWDPNYPFSYSGELWELDAVEVVPRAVPPSPGSSVGAPELQALAEENVTLSALENYLQSRSLALIVGRDVTTRDRNDRQQPYNLRVSGTAHQTTGSGGTIYDIRHLQIMQADLLRSLTFQATSGPAPGRRVLAQPLHDPNADNPPNTGGPPGSVRIAVDGSIAALVPARRALSWQTVDAAGTPVVRERYWVSFQPGEIRTCTSCHGISSATQANQPPPTNKPEALKLLLQHLKSNGSL